MISLTVGLPIYKGRDIAWLAIENLCNQIDITFDWQLIVMEEEAGCFGAHGIEPYIERLKANRCVSLKYVPLSYHIPLPQKWKRMAEMAEGEVFCFHSADDYPPLGKLRLVHDKIKEGFDWIGYKKYLMFDLNLKKHIVFDGRNWKPGYIAGTVTEKLKNIPDSFENRGIDKFIYTSISPINPYIEISGECFTGFCTNGANIISKDRVRQFAKPTHPFYSTDKTINSIVSNEIYSMLLNSVKKDNTKKKHVVAGNVEFGYELISALPYAYKLFLDGQLEQTTSAKDTDCLYFFSPKHNIDSSKRCWDNMKHVRTLPNINIHTPTLDLDNFQPPPLKEQYKNDRFVFDKPIICICNRVNIEWNRDVINYFDVECLEKLFKMLHKKYQIVYFNIEGRKELYDGAEPISIGDFDLVKKYGISIHNLYDKNKDLTFNTLQLMVMANCERFITLNGGYSILASYFGGTNIIYTKECREIRPEVNSYYRWYDKFGGSRIEHVDSYNDLFDMVDIIYNKEMPLINLMLRTHNRPKMFAKCYNSIKNQTYKNIRILAGFDNKETELYLTPYKCRQIGYEPITERTKKQEGFGQYFPFNNYTNILKNEAKTGYIMGLDDDDCFLNDNALEEITNHITSENDLLLWRVDLGTIIPSDENFGKNIVMKDIAGIGFMCHTKHLKNYQWEPYRRSDYRVIKYLSEKLNVIWIDQVLTGSQNQKCNYGKSFA